VIHTAMRETVIEPQGSHWYAELAELPDYTGFLFILLWRDIKVRYKQSVFGIGWAVAQPLMMTVVFTVIFGGVAKMPSGDAPYALFSYSGLLPWLLFQKTLTQGASSLVTFRSELTKIYFPRITAPLVSLMAAGVDFLITLAILFVMMAYFRVGLHWPVLTAPLFVAYAGVASLSVALWLAAINVEYRDIQQIIPLLAQIWLFVTPVVYPSSLIAAKYAPIFWLNPASVAVEGFRWAMLGTAPPPPMAYAISATVIAIIGTTGLNYFNRTARTMADRI